MNFISLIAIYVLLNSTGQLLIKLGSLKLASSQSLQDVLLNFRLIFGIILFGMSFLTWIYILTKVNLSYAFPFAVGLGYMSVILLSALFLREAISMVQWLGIFLVGAGVIVMTMSGTR